MAVFMLNVCKFNSCGLKFPSLGHLIQHIEETHIDYDPHVVERTEQQQPACIPLSYVLRFLADGTRREIGSCKPHSQQQAATSSNNNSLPVGSQLQQPARPASQSSASSSTTTSSSVTTSTSLQQQQQLQQQLHQTCKSLTPTGSEAEEGEDFLSEPEDSNDSWTTLEEFSQDFILRYGSRNASQQSTANVQSGKDEKPFACPVPGCKKRYKNVNGIKYHSKNGHKNDGKVRKAFKCPCGKSYKTPYGLKNHTSIRHNGRVASFKYTQAVKQSLDGQQQQRRHSRSGVSSVPKIQKVPAMQDHGYMKPQEHCDGEPDCEYEIDNLGVLTPASTPPLPSPGVKEQPPQFYSNNKYLAANAYVNSSQTHVRQYDN